MMYSCEANDKGKETIQNINSIGILFENFNYCEVARMSRDKCLWATVLGQTILGQNVCGQNVLHSLLKWPSTVTNTKI